MKTAIILCGRRERDSELPYPLINFADKQNLLDRTLALLEELGYQKIYLVVGFKAELFERYATSSIKIVVNPDYQFSSSMGSLACVEGLVKEDFLLIEGDTFYERRVLESMTETTYATCLAITEESGSGDEAFVEHREGFITKISKDIHQVCHSSGELLGILRIAYPVFKRMLDLWHQSSNPYVNYEYILFDVTIALERPSIFFSDLIWGDVDCQKDFNQLVNYIYPKLRRREDPFDQYNLVQHLRTILGDECMDDTTSIKTIGGMSNKNFQVEVQGSRYVLRVPGIGSEGMVERAKEVYNNRLAEELGITPTLDYFNAETGVKLARFIPEAETLNKATIKKPENLRKIADILKKLHTANVRFSNSFDVFKEIEHYEVLLTNAHGIMYSGYEDVRTVVFELQVRLNKLGLVLKPCHNDLVAENFIKSSTGDIYLIDWEYSGMNDPIWDISAMFLESDFNQESKEYFYKHYFDEDHLTSIKIVEEKVLIYQILMDVLWSIWTCIKEAKGDDFGSYGIDRFKRALNNLSKLHELQAYETQK